MKKLFFAVLVLLVCLPLVAADNSFHGFRLTPENLRPASAEDTARALAAIPARSGKISTEALPPGPPSDSPFVLILHRNEEFPGPGTLFNFRVYGSGILKTGMIIVPRLRTMQGTLIPAQSQEVYRDGWIGVVVWDSTVTAAYLLNPAAVDVVVFDKTTGQVWESETPVPINGNGAYMIEGAPVVSYDKGGNVILDIPGVFSGAPTQVLVGGAPVDFRTVQGGIQAYVPFYMSPGPWDVTVQQNGHAETVILDFKRPAKG